MKLMQDENGNVLLVEQTRVRQQGGSVLLLDLFIRVANEKHRRHIGRINTETRRFHVERNEDMHLLKKANAYGFNHYILKSATTFDNVVLHETCSRCVYVMERKHMLNEGQFLFFKQQGYEKQIFLTREWIAHYEKQSENVKQLLRNEYKLHV